MNQLVRLSCGIVLGMFLLSAGHAEAPVVDESEHFTVFDDDGVKPPQAAAPSRHSQQLAVNDTPIAQSFPEEKPQDLSLPSQLRALQQEVQSLRGELEVQAHTVEQLKQQQLMFYKDIDARLNKVGNGSYHDTMPTSRGLTAGSNNDEARRLDPAVKPRDIESGRVGTHSQAPSATVEHTTPAPISNVTVTNPMPANAANPADEQVAYLAAYDLVKAKRYDDALVAMQAFIKQYPTGGYTANAEYWTGELYLAKNNPVDAIQHFETVLHQFSSSSKAAASALKLGYALSALGKTEEAKQRLREVIKNYPDTAAAQLAKSKLDSL